MADLTHFDDHGASRMVDVGDKAITARVAVPEAFVSLRPETLTQINNKDLAKGDVYEVARLAGIMGAKKTADLIPLCHPLGLDSVTIDFETT
ncbi:MAG: cyclic pyranopterin monophosphate synthase MoaC, partial [Planctomycetaceae bacterium]|nr:cyclic pyranopterin monophosphate synthase MoaC [Planctomycetaceae bacterium]